MSLVLKPERRVHAAYLGEVERRNLHLAFLQPSGALCLFVCCEVEGGTSELVRVIDLRGVRK
ncbi:hypothetical protein BIV03_13130 [Curtobacterium sp. MCBA15_016]|nr:hypothetical protein BIV03_13130 [Curtobacterium sp. MCBA15_016]